MDPAGSVLLLETMGERAANAEWARRHFKNSYYQPPEGLESRNKSAVSHLPTLIGDERLIVGSRLRYDLASLGLGITSILAVDLATDPVVRTFFHELMQLGGNVPQKVAEFILNKPALPVQITMDCALFTGMQVELGNATIPKREVLRDAYLISTICWVTRMSNSEGT